MAEIYRARFGREEIYNLRDKYVPIHREFEEIINLMNKNEQPSSMQNLIDFIDFGKAFPTSYSLKIIDELNKDFYIDNYYVLYLPIDTNNTGLYISEISQYLLDYKPDVIITENESYSEIIYELEIIDKYMYYSFNKNIDFSNANINEDNYTFNFSYEDVLHSNASINEDYTLDFSYEDVSHSNAGINEDYTLNFSYKDVSHSNASINNDYALDLSHKNVLSSNASINEDYVLDLFVSNQSSSNASINEDYNQNFTIE